MKNSQIIKPTLSEYSRIQDFASACAELNTTLSLLNNHIEVLKRSGDVNSIRDLDHQLNTFLSEVISNYKNTLNDEQES